MSCQETLKAIIEGHQCDESPFVVESLRNTARAMVEDAAGVKEGQKVLLWFDEPGIQLVQQLNLACLARGAQVSYFQRDLDEDALVIPTLSPEEITSRFNEEERLINEAEVVLIVRGPNNPEAMKNVPPELKSIYTQRYSKVHDRRVRGDVDWTLFLWPTQYEAEKEGLPYDEYFRVYMEACNQPWRAIKDAQKILKQKLDAGETLQLIASENDSNPRKRTNITMSINGMTFCNSTIDKNYPGSEVFSAPVVDSVNGQIYAEGEYLYDGFLMRNIFFRVENGVIVEAVAEEGNDGLQTILGQGGGARKFGEVALGTNPGLIRRMFNDLLNEKVGGSFHMAIGHCYTLTKYGEDEVCVNNGNTEEFTPNHWDLTILMHRKADGSGGGKVILDGEVIQEDGIFVDPRLAVLNPKFR